MIKYKDLVFTGEIYEEIKDYVNKEEYEFEDSFVNINLLFMYLYVSMSCLKVMSMHHILRSHTFLRRHL